MEMAHEKATPTPTKSGPTPAKKAAESPGGPPPLPPTSALFHLLPLLLPSPLPASICLAQSRLGQLQ